MNVVSSFDLMQALAALDQVRKRLITADVEHDVDILFVFEVAIEANNTFMIQRAMNFDLACQFLAGFGPSEIGLGNDF